MPHNATADDAALAAIGLVIELARKLNAKGVLTNGDWTEMLNNTVEAANPAQRAGVAAIIKNIAGVG